VVAAGRPGDGHIKRTGTRAAGVPSVRCTRFRAAFRKQRYSSQHAGRPPSLLRRHGLLVAQGAGSKAVNRTGWVGTLSAASSLDGAERKPSRYLPARTEAAPQGWHRRSVSSRMAAGEFAKPDGDAE
jgi:hypothetical protein